MNNTSYSEGHKAYFRDEKYSASSNLDWQNGWTAAQRESRCRWYDEIGRPDSARNKDV